MFKAGISHNRQLNTGRMKYLFDGVVAGISCCGNSIGIPMVAGGIDSPVMVVAETGRDGIHGAIFASEELNEVSVKKKGRQFRLVTPLWKS